MRQFDETAARAPAGRTGTYRPEIDGLRGVAVASVVAFHVGLPGFGGGFVGVDVFLVISGFLITTLLLDELRARGTIDLLAFYARRARRLLPAFLLVVSATLLLGSFFLVPVDGEQQGLARSAMAAAVYLSNFHFAQQGDGYFDAPTGLYPLLHTWSLAIEEQFYLIWPLLLIGAACAARLWRMGLLRVSGASWARCSFSRSRTAPGRRCREEAPRRHRILRSPPEPGSWPSAR